MQFPERHYRWEWRLRSTPEQLWPLASDTNRFNRDAGLPAVRRIGEGAGGNARQRLGFSRLGVRVEWDEEPFEWVRPYHFGVRRRYRSGPVATMRVLATLTREPDGGTRLRYETWVRPRTLLGIVAAPLGMRFVTRRAFGNTFRQYDRLPKEADAPLAPERRDVELTPGGAARLDAITRQLIGQSGAPDLVARLIAAVEQADDFALARLRPYALADAWGVPRREMLELCLWATRLGLFDLQWDLLCPLCRGAKASTATLAETTRQVHCDACNIDFSVNFDRSVELTFRPNPAIRAVVDESYCVGGPQVTPHIIAQQLLAGGARQDVTLQLEPGRYRLRTLGLPGGAFLVAAPDGVQEVTLAARADGWPDDEQAVALAPTLHLENATGAEQLCILERMAWTDQATTAADVTSLQVFRDLFTSELLRPGEQISLGSLTILFTDLRDSTSFYRRIGDPAAFARVLDHFGVVREAIVAEGGAIVKTIGDAVMAVFREPCGAVRAMLRAQAHLAAPPAGGTPLHLKAGMHYGPCIAVTMNDRLDYFGSTVNLASRLERFSSGTDVVISDAIRQDPAVVALLSTPGSGLTVERFEVQLKGFAEEQFPLWRIAHDGFEVPCCSEGSRRPRVDSEFEE